jgi:O-antigen ligase
VRIPFLSESTALRMAAGAALLLGLIGGALAEGRASYAVIVCVVLAGVLALAMLGDRAFPWALVVVAVAPWYPFIAEAAEPPIVRQKVLCAAIAAAPLAPWLWSLAVGGRRTRPSRRTLLMAILFAGLAVLIYNKLGSISALIASGIVGYLFIGVTFLCARRFGRAEGWPAAAFAGLVVLGLMGADAYVRAPSLRVGYFAGYPITYGALVVGLLPLGMLFAYRRSRLLAAGLAAGAAVVLILSESRSSWVAATVLVIAVVILQARAGNFRTLAAVASVLVIVVALVLGTSSLHHIVEEKLSSKVQSTQSVTHREWSYGYALETIGQQPLFGAGYPGYSAEESANKTSIGAIDNGYLSITVDMGIMGLIAAFIPIAVALRTLGRCLRFGRTPTLELALALGVLGMAVVTIFYDSFYWAQIDLLMAAMGGVLSTRVGAIARGQDDRLGARLRRERSRIAWRRTPPAGRPAILGR